MPLVKDCTNDKNVLVHMEHSDSFEGDIGYRDKHMSKESLNLLLSNTLEPPPTPFYNLKGQYCATEETSLHCHTKDKAKLQATRLAQRKLIIASIVCLLFMVGEFIGMMIF